MRDVSLINETRRAAGMKPLSPEESHKMFMEDIDAALDARDRENRKADRVIRAAYRRAGIRQPVALSQANPYSEISPSLDDPGTFLKMRDEAKQLAATDPAILLEWRELLHDLHEAARLAIVGGAKLTEEQIAEKFEQVIRQWAASKKIDPGKIDVPDEARQAAARLRSLRDFLKGEAASTSQPGQPASAMTSVALSGGDPLKVTCRGRHHTGAVSLAFTDSRPGKGWERISGRESGR